MANPKPNARIFFISGGGADFIDVLETVAQLTSLIQPVNIGAPAIWPTPFVTLSDGNNTRVWVNMHAVTRIIPQ